MSKKSAYPFFTKAETAEKRLEELINHESISAIMQGPQSYYHSIKGSNMKLYPDGYEANGMLYVKNFNLIVWYDIKKEREQQSNLIGVEK